jgi:hypothetical protein
MLVRCFVFIHVLSAITFFLAHGAAAAMVFRVRSEKDFIRIQGMLDLAISTFRVIHKVISINGTNGFSYAFPAPYLESSLDLVVNPINLVYGCLDVCSEREEIQTTTPTNWFAVHAG